jgi:kumamolisin
LLQLQQGWLTVTLKTTILVFQWTSMSLNSSKKAILGSEKNLLPDSRSCESVDLNEYLEVTVRLRRRKELPSLQMQGAQLPYQREYISSEEYAANYGADPKDLEKIEIFAHEHGLIVEESSIPKRSVILSGTVDAFRQAFNVELQLYEYASGSYRGRTGAIYVPAELEGIVTGVFGLDNRVFAKPHYCIGVGKSAKHKDEVSMVHMDEVSIVHTDGTINAFFPTQIAQLYNFPTNVNGKGQTIGIIALGGGFRFSELQTYFNQLGIAPPSISVASFPQAGTNSPGEDPLNPKNPDLEVMIDIQVAGAVAPGANIVVYFARGADDKSFLDVMAAAVNDEINNPSVISISWGGPESRATTQFLQEFDQLLQTAAHKGITVCVASGDNGSADFPLNVPGYPWDSKAHVDFPASSPFALSCGGTRLFASKKEIFKEVTWYPKQNFGTGGGVSRYFPLPSYQTEAGVPIAKNPSGDVGRGVPDVSGNAAQESGYCILCDGLMFPDPNHDPPLYSIYGTSAVAPLWAGLIALINQSLGKRVGFINPLLYRFSTTTDVFQDITEGSNGDYPAGPGWDACTGLGTPNGQKLLNILRGDRE